MIILKKRHEQEMEKLRKELKAAQEDRDYWKRVADATIQQIKRIVDREIYR